MVASQGRWSVPQSQPHHSESSGRYRHAERFELAVQFFPESVNTIELQLDFGVLDAEALEPISLAVDSSNSNGVAQVVEPPFQPTDIPFCRRQLLLKPGLTNLSRSPCGRSLRRRSRDRCRR